MSAVRAEQVQETGEPEDLESFRRRVQGFLRANFRQVTMEEMRWDFHADEEEELAEIAHERELQRALYDAGLAGLCFPREYGGQGLMPAYQQVLNEELAGYEYPRRVQIPTFSPCATVLLEFGTEEQKQRHLPAILRGEELWMQFLSEPSGGSDVAGALTTAVRDGDQWVLNGSKIWTTGAWWSDWGLCLARTNWDVPKHRGLSVFIFPIHQPSIEVHRIEMLNGSREFCQEFLTDVIVPDTDRVGDVDDGWTVGIRWMFHERMLYTSPYVTHPVGSTPSRMYSGTVHAIAQEAGPHGRPVRARPGGRGAHARAGERGDVRPRRRAHDPGPTFRPGRRAGASRQGAGANEDQHAGPRGGRVGRGGLDRGQCRGPQRRQLLDAPGRQHRWRHGGDGAQRGQRAGAVHAAERTLDKDRPFRDVPRGRSSQS